MMPRKLTLKSAEGGEIIAQLDVDEQGYLSADATLPAQVAGIVERVNALESLRVDAIPPEGAAQFEVFAMDVRRADPEIADIVAQFIRERFGLQAEVSAG